MIMNVFVASLLLCLLNGHIAYVESTSVTKSVLESYFNSSSATTVYNLTTLALHGNIKREVGFRG